MPGVKRTAAGRPRRSTRNTTAAAAASNASFDAAAAASDDAEGEVISVSSSSAAGSSEVVSAADEDEDDHATRPKRARRVAAARGSTSTIGDSPVATRQPALAPAAAAAAAAAIATRRVPAPRTAKPIPASLLVDDESNSDEDDFMPSSASGSQASQPTPMRGMASSSPGVTPARRFAHKSTDVLNADVNNQAMHVDDDDDDDDDDWSALASPIQGAKLARPTRARRATRNSNSNSTPARKRFGRAVSSDSDDGSFHNSDAVESISSDTASSMSDGSESDVEEETEDLLDDDSTTTASTTAPTPPTPATPSPTAATLNRRRQPRGRGGRAAGVSSTDLHPVDPNTNEVVDTHLSVLEKRYRRFLDNRHERIYLVHPELRTVWTDLDARIAKRAALVPEAAVVAPADKDGPAGPPRMAAPPTLLLRLLPFQEESLAWLLAQEASDLKGGILADEMGMGKTIQIISMLLASDKHPGHPTLIITPTVAMLQWLSELTKHTAPGTLAVHVHHKKTGRVTDAADLARFDVVLTTYALLEGDFRRSTYGSVRKAGKVIEPSVLQNVEWHRVVLDEAHCIKDRSCSTSRAAFALKSTVRWSLTGTPLQNRVGELYSLIRFMRLDPFSYYFCTQCSCKSLNWSFAGQRSCTDCGHRPMDHFCWWNSEVLKPIQRYGGFGPGRVAFEQLGRLMNLCMLRRTKLERAADLGLPPRIVVTRRDMFNEEEEDFYQSLYKESKTRFQTYVDAGTVLSNYAHVFELLTKMRQAANHPYLVKLNMAPSATTAADSMQVLVCGICHEEAEDAIVAASCRHVFCREDMHLYLSSSGVDKPQCPVCFRPLTVDMNQPTFEPPNPTGGTAARKKPSIINRMVLDRWRSSTKIEALLEELYRLRADDKSIKSIVFSQYVNFLDLVEWRLLKGGIRCVKLDGRMSPEQRDNVIKAFSTNPQITVFLVSLKAGGVALNLTEASRVFMMDLWWNGAVEAQAQDRIHRLGQHRPIQVTRIIIENSIESRVAQLQEKKNLLFQSAVGMDPEALNKLSIEDMQFLFQ